MNATCLDLPIPVSFKTRDMISQPEHVYCFFTIVCTCTQSALLNSTARAKFHKDMRGNSEQLPEAF